MVATGQPRRGEVVPVTFTDTQPFDDALTDFGLPVEEDKQRYCYGDVGKQTLPSMLTYLHFPSSTCYDTTFSPQRKQIQTNMPDSGTSYDSMLFVVLLITSAELELLDR